MRRVTWTYGLAVLALIVIGSLGDLSAQQDPVPMGVGDADSPTPDLNRLLPLADSNWVEAGMFLTNRKIALLEGATQSVYLVNTADGSVVRAGGPEHDPGPVTILLERLPGGGVATIDADRTFVRFSADGSVLSATSVAVERGTDVVGLFPDGALAFREEVGADATPVAAMVRPADQGSVREDVTYRVLRPSGVTPVIAKAQGDEAEIVSASGLGRTSSTQLRIMFGHETFDDLSGDVLIVAQSDVDQILLFDASGQVTGQIPMPLRRVYQPTQTDVQAQRIVRLAERRRATRAQRHALLSNERFARMAQSMADADSLLLWTATSSNVLPPIDRLIADASGRVWLRILALPHESMACWQVWDLDGPKLVRTVAMARSARLLDSQDDWVLLQVSDRYGNNDRTVIRRLVRLDPSAGEGVETCASNGIEHETHSKRGAEY